MRGRAALASTPNPGLHKEPLSDIDELLVIENWDLQLLPENIAHDQAHPPAFAEAKEEASCALT